ncbi:MAG: ATP-binding protein [Mycoplasmataceae bacterium]|nr:ATP-binding protein [Mycoplasmataceae bacterium]
MTKIIERRIYTENIKKFIDKQVVKVITGIRRSGKSEILKLIRKEVSKKIDDQHIIFINFEDIEFEDLKIYKNLHNYILNKIHDDQKYYLFFDEIQLVTGWEKTINSLRLRNTDIFITGSTTKLLSSELATLLSGRYIQFEIRPLTFNEYINFHHFDRVQLASTIENKNLNDYINLGGFPFIAINNLTQEEATAIVKDIHSSIVLKDVVSRNNIKNVPLLEKVIAYFYDNVGNLTSLRNIAQYISGGGKEKVHTNLDTISNYVNYLETAYVVKKAQRYDIKGKKLFKINDKYYLADHSLAYVLRDTNKVNKGRILENIVFNELIARDYAVYVGKLDTKEIDFIAERKGEKIYVQVCLEFSNHETYTREFTPLKNIKDNYPKYVVSLGENPNHNDAGIIGISLKDFLLKKNY